MPLSGGLITWKIFKRDFLDRFFLREKREARVQEFINLRQVGLTVFYYSLKVTKFSRYAPSSVSDPRDEISRFVMGVLDYLKKSVVFLCYMII